FRIEQRPAERQPDYVIQMRMREEQVELGCPVVGQGIAKLAQAGAGIEHQHMIAAAHLDARGVAAVAQRVGSGTGEAASHPPEPSIKLVSHGAFIPSSFCGSLPVKLWTNHYYFDSPPAVRKVTAPGGSRLVR